MTEAVRRRAGSPTMVAESSGPLLPSTASEPQLRKPRLHGGRFVVRKSSLSALALASLVTLSASALPALAAAELFNIDPGHSSVGFKVRHIVSKVPGRFDKISGTITVDPADLSTAKVSVEIESASINTANENRDNDLKSPNFFDVAKFPKATFVSTSVTPNGEGKAKLKGNLTI